MPLNKTSIEWVKNPDGTQGYTWNPITGCLNGCEYCYARKLANTRLRERYLANINVAPINLSTHPSRWAEAVNRKALTDTLDPFYPRFWPEKLISPIHIGSAGYRPRKAKGIFVCDMSDLFGIGIPEEWTQKVFSSIRTNPDYRFYLLTKQPQNLIKWSPFPDNCWVGVTATDAIMAFRAEDALAHIEATVKFISFEPLLSRIENPDGLLACLTRHIDWVIIGAQTKPYKPPKIEWVSEIIQACDKAKIPVFLKDNLRPLIDKHCPDESNIQPNHDRQLRMKHPFLCEGCDEEGCHKCGVIWGLRQEMPK